MRLPEDKIKQAILHPDADIRERAVRYFAASFSQDTSIVSLVIEAVERYGRDGAYRLVGSCTDLAHTDETIAWAVDELNREDADRYENYAFNLTRVLCHADPALLVHRDTRVIESRHFLAGLRDSFLERIEMLSWDEATCWRELEEICEAGKDKEQSNEVDLDRASHIVEALARIGGPQCEERVRSVLSENIESFENNPLKWMEPLMVQLAGLMRRESAVPLVVQKLRQDDCFLAGHCEDALARIGGDSIVAAVANEIHGAARHFRIYGTAVLERIHTDLAAEKCVALLAQEKDRIIKRDLAHAALAQFAYAAVEPVRQLLLVRPHQGEWRHLRDELVLVCRMMERRFPEYEEWMATGERERQEHRRKIEELHSDPQRLLAWSFQQLAEYAETDLPEEGESTRKAAPPSVGAREPELPDEYAGAVTQAAAPKASAERIGRNDPCPCGSGKKFKKCCMKKQQGGLPLD